MKFDLQLVSEERLPKMFWFPILRNILTEARFTAVAAKSFLKPVTCALKLLYKKFAAETTKYPLFKD